ncbi:hypothetical protein PF008_g18094 [Phytophthora fragariae]|uniref:Uncharacterized protein n=1 Tax=Phytophthora fragariae TaxID=53985 RepID=A0A6G0R6B8_9STRA|nr:hypothetical protein PF008_g18094 [Phytophthora fragariae]
MAMINSHHDECKELLNGVKERLNVLMALQGRVMEQLEIIENRVTRAPFREKMHGLAVTIYPPLQVRGQHEIRVLAGQADYIARKTRNVRQENFLLTFTETKNPIDLRNNFRTAANQRIQQNIRILEDEGTGRKRKITELSSDAADRRGMTTKTFSR